MHTQHVPLYSFKITGCISRIAILAAVATTAHLHVLRALALVQVVLVRAAWQRGGQRDALREPAEAPA
eukprot:352743-Chlamydomonas_euryale.AAC.12